jgi:hypothetical protein
LVAEPAAQTFSLVYAAPEGCPARSTFVASILARAPGSREATTDAELAFEARLAADGDLTRGLFTVRFAHGDRFEREVPAARCADVTTSMAIMAGLLLSGALLPEKAAEPPPVAAPVPAPPAAPPPPPVAEAPAPPAAVASRATSAPAEGETLGRFRVGAFAHAVLDLGALPFPAFGGDVGLDAALDRSSPLSPSLRAGFSYRAGKASHPPVGDGLFALKVLMVRACPLRFAPGPPLAIHACALVDLGQLRVSARNTTHPADRSMPWLAMGAAGRLELRLASAVSLETELSLYGLARHDQFLLEPGDLELHDIPAVAAEASVGIVARLP